MIPPLTFEPPLRRAGGNQAVESLVEIGQLKPWPDAELDLALDRVTPRHEQPEPSVSLARTEATPSRASERKVNKRLQADIVAGISGNNGRVSNATTANTKRSNNRLNGVTHCSPSLVPRVARSDRRPIDSVATVAGVPSGSGLWTPRRRAGASASRRSQPAQPSRALRPALVDSGGGRPPRLPAVWRVSIPSLSSRTTGPPGCFSPW